MGGEIVMHRIIVGVTFATLLFCSFGLAGGQDSGDKDSLHPAFKVLNGSHANPRITLPELLDSYERAVGGKEAIGKIRTVLAYEERRAQTKTEAPRLGSAVEYYKFPKAKIAFTTPSGSKDAGSYDGKTSWHDDPNERVQQMPSKMNALAAKGMPSEMNVFAARESGLFDLLHLRVAFPQMRLTGSSKVEGRDVYVVDAPIESGLYRHLFFDAETKLLISTVVIQLAGGQTLISQQFYSDFRVVNGVKFPFAVRAIEYTSQSSVEIKITRIEINIPPPDVSSQ
jgi:zinc protease